MRKKLLMTALTASLAFTALGIGCSKDKDGDAAEASVSFGQSTAYFLSGDQNIRPISTLTPNAGEAIEKEIQLSFEDATTVALSFEYEGKAPSGLSYSVNGTSAVRTFTRGEFFRYDVEEDVTETTVTLKVWLAVETPTTVAETDFSFDIKATAISAAEFVTTASNEGNKLTFGSVEDYVWSSSAQSYFDGFTYEILDEEPVPVNLCDLFEESTLSAKFTANGETVDVADPMSFKTTTDGTLTVISNKVWCNVAQKEIPVTVDWKYSTPHYPLSMKVAYPVWYTESVATVSVTALNTITMETFVKAAQYDKETGNYVVNLPDGTYDVTVTDSRFRKDETDEGYSYTGIVVEGAEKALDTADLTFAMPKLGNDKDLTYNAGGSVTIGKGNKQFHTLNDVTAEKGFVVSYTMATPARTSEWFNGGFAFKMGTNWYSLLVYTRKMTANTTVRIGLTDQAQTNSSTPYSCSWVSNSSEPCFLSTPVTLSADEVLSMDITVAYYDGSFYVQIGDKYAFRINPELFDMERPKTTNAPVFFGSDVDSATDNGNKDKREKFSSKGASKFFAEGERALGFRAIDFANTFSNIQYTLTDEGAKEAIKSMRLISESMGNCMLDVLEENEWPAFSDLPAYAWTNEAKELAESGIAHTNDGVAKLDLTALFDLSTMTAVYTVGDESTAITDLTAFIPTESGTLTLTPRVIGSAKTKLNVVITVTQVPKHNELKARYDGIISMMEGAGLTTLTATYDEIFQKLKIKRDVNFLWPTYSESFERVYKDANGNLLMTNGVHGDIFVNPITPYD